MKPAKKAARKTQEIATTKDQKLIEAAAQIATTPPDGFGEFMAFAHAVLCQVGLLCLDPPEWRWCNITS